MSQCLYVLILNTLSVFLQFTGQPSVLYYAPSIFENIGFQSHSAATLATVGIGITKVKPIQIEI